MSETDNELQQARRIIDSVNDEMAILFEKRMKAVKTVGDFKKKNGLPILDAEREKAVLEAAAKRVTDPELRPYYLEVVKKMMEVAKEYQNLDSEEKS